MDFVINNYLWFVIGAVVLLMIIIGYFAEKTNFGKIPLNTRKEKKEKTVEDASSPVDTEAKELPIDETAINNDILNSDSMQQIGIADAITQPESLNVSEEIKEPLADNAMPEEDLNVPFGDQVVEEPKEDKTASEITENLPDIPEVPEVSKEDSGMSDESEDDVWKF